MLKDIYPIFSNLIHIYYIYFHNTFHDIYHIERGYSSLIEKLCALGADIRRETILTSDKTV